MMGISGNVAAGMVLTPEMAKQLGQCGQGIGIPQGMPIMGLPPGIANLPQGLGVLPQGLNLPPGVGIMTPEMLNSLPPQQK